LNASRIVEVAKRSGCDAIHPGYGFLSENADFAQAVAEAGLVFVGPPAKVQRLLGEKTAARRLARDVNVPVAEGTEPLRDAAAARAAAKDIGYPVLLKPAGGGGGKGVRVVGREEDFEAAWRGATGEATAAFGSSTRSPRWSPASTSSRCSSASREVSRSGSRRTRSPGRAWRSSAASRPRIPSRDSSPRADALLSSASPPVPGSASTRPSSR